MAKALVVVESPAKAKTINKYLGRDYKVYGIGAVWYFGDNMGVSFNYDMRSGDNVDLDNMGVGFRFNFN